MPEWLQPTLTGAETLQRLAKAAPAARDNWQALSRLGRLLKGQPMAGPDLLQRQVNKLQGKKEVTEDAEGDVNMGEQRAGAGTSGAASPAAVAQGKDGSSSGAGAEGGSGSASGTSSPGDNASQGSQGGEEGAVGSAAALEAILLPSIKRSEKLPAW